MILDPPRLVIHPLHALVKDAAFDPVSVKVIPDAKQPERHVVYPHEVADGLIKIVKLRGMDNETVQHSHPVLQGNSGGKRPETMVFESTPSPPRSESIIILA
jgi:hypothetical protein